MKKLLYISILLVFSFAYAQSSEVYEQKGKFGLISGSEKITEAKYSKLIKLRDNSYLFCKKEYLSGNGKDRYAYTYG